MTKPINTDSIEQTTGKSWSDWTTELDAQGAQAMTHPELARHLGGLLEGKVESPGWWAQSMAVAYEQHTGKRRPGQVADGTYEIAVSKTVLSPRDQAFPQVVAWLEAQTTFNGQSYDNERSSETPVRSYWRCDLADGTKFTSAVEAAGADKSKLVCAHSAISSQAAADEWREFWRTTVAQLADK